MHQICLVSKGIFAVWPKIFDRYRFLPVFSEINGPEPTLTNQSHFSLKLFYNRSNIHLSSALTRPGRGFERK